MIPGADLFGGGTRRQAPKPEEFLEIIHMIPDSIAIVGSLISSAKSAFDMAKTVKDLAPTSKDQIDFTKRSIDLANMVIALQDAVSAHQNTVSLLETEIRDLKEKVAHLENNSHDLGKYRLKEIATGVLVYWREIDVDSTEPSHYLCANCFTQGKKSILQLKSPGVGGHFYHCHLCDSEICDHSKRVDINPIVPVRRSERSRW